MKNCKKFRVHRAATVRTARAIEIDVSFRIDLESATQQLSPQQIEAILIGVGKVVAAAKGLNASVLR
jgi:hypothetical protein